MTESWVEQAEAYLGTHQWGPNGKYLGVSRMLKDEDLHSLQKGKYVASQRPRGILSGFLAILPKYGPIVYIPPISGKVGPMRIRLRHRIEKGAIFSAYWMQKDLVLEDILVWNEEPVWCTKSFDERWKIMKNVVENYYKPDIVQKFGMRLAKYQSLASLQKPDDSVVLEFVPNDPKQKRIIWTQERKNIQVQPARIQPAPVEHTKPKQTVKEFSAKKDVHAGPDVYNVYRGTEKLGYALVKTLAISKALRKYAENEIQVDAVWNPQFSKWEIKQILS
jgi:hypothetical protein